ncbi:Menin [Eumeta japonica]|uniref:Menin n=1 Tax=Eumeta variegata TaxID=151549 RepID=A0A4C2A789_EUMVA|nr:Menin [Eumeta japonica]
MHSLKLHCISGEQGAKQANQKCASNSPLISLNSPLDPSLFPLKSIDDVVNFFKRSLELYHTQNLEPDLTLLSIVAGYTELSLTTGDSAQAAAAAAAEHASSSSSNAAMPTTLTGIVGSGASTAALAVVAGCQLLGYRGVRLAISEDHAWVVFGNKKLETIEITWHGKGSEDKRGQDITSGIESGSWLYLGGLAVICDKGMEVAAIASAINISLSANSDCVEVQELQQRLLWLLYDKGHLKISNGFRSICKSFALYDGICQWEEDSLTPILHIGWAKPLVNNICKFDYEVRSQVVIKVPEDELQAVRGSHAQKIAAEIQQRDHDETLNEAKNQKLCTSDMCSPQHIEGNNNLVKKEEKTHDGKKREMPTTLADLTAACGEKILNPDFLLQGGGQPFAEQQKLNNQHDETSNGKAIEIKAKYSKTDITPTLHSTIPVSTSADDCNTSSRAGQSSMPQCLIASAPVIDEEDPLHYMLKRPVITLYSQKMKGLRDLLLAEKLNTHAISLQVTAQSVE